MFRYLDDLDAGITRRKVGEHWGYFAPDGGRITDRDEIDRLNKLAVPPAYERVWYSPDPGSHLQATGFDARGRKQYRYHPDFRAHQEAAKYDRCAAFGHRLPKLRAKVAADLDGVKLSHDRIVAAVVRLLDEAHVRVGNEQYANANDSYGATTLRTDHSRVKGEDVTLSYRGKSGKDQHVRVHDKALARIVRRCQDLPGQALFQYMGGDGVPHRIGSGDVNQYIHDVMGEAFSAKHFRTWAASVIAYATLVDWPDGEPVKLKGVLEPVSKALGNTPAIARKSYVHPMVLDAVASGAAREWRGMTLPRPAQWLMPAERGLLAILDAGEPLTAAAA